MSNQRMVALLVKLEGSFDAADLDDATARELVSFALRDSTDYWADLALDWVEAGVSASLVEEDLRALASSDPDRPQRLRHKAKGLIPLE